MAGKVSISAYQAMWYQVGIVLATAILFVPAIVAADARQDAWLSLVPAYLFGSLQVYVATRLAQRFPGETVVQYAPRVAGRVPGKLIAFVYVFYFFFVGYFVQQEFAALMASGYMPLTPPVVFMLVLAGLAAYAAYGGLEVICRVNTLVLSVALAALVIVFLLVVKDIKIWRFLPVLENGPEPVVLGALPPGGWFGETAVILMLYPFIADKEKAVRAGLLAVFLLFLAMELVVVSSLGLEGPLEAARFLFPTFNVVRRIRLEALPILERQDAVFMMIWVAAMMVKLTTFFFAAVLGLAQWAGARDHRTLILPAAAVMTALAVQAWKNIPELFAFSSEVFPLTIIFVNFFCTVLVLALAVARGIAGSPAGRGGERG
ncbi:MAG: endospore germination permease [Bacillota bacterium]